MPRWRVPVEVIVEAASPAAARAQVTKQLTHLAAAERTPATPSQYALAAPARAATPAQPLTTRRTTTAPQRPVRRKRPS